MFFLKRAYICLTCLLFVSSICITASGESGKIRIAIFDEPGFPNKSGRTVEWFKNTAGSAGYYVKILTLKEVQSEKSFSREEFDTIVFPHGGYVPLDAEEALSRFMGKGGSIIIAGDMFGKLPYPDKVKEEYQKLSKEFQSNRGKMIEKYGNFMVKNGLTESCFLRYSDEVKRWIVPIAYQYYHLFIDKKVMDEFGLCGWPNHICFANGRPFNEPVMINPILKTLLADFPQRVDPSVKMQKSNGLIRVNIQTSGSGGTGAQAYNSLISLYKFPKPSGFKYTAFENAGKQEEDCNTDFFIYRYHDYLHDGASLIVLGKTGTLLLDSNNGEQIFAGLLKLANSRLPGEFETEYYKKFHAADKSISDLRCANLKLCSTLSTYAKLLYAANDKEGYNDTEKLLETQKKIFNIADSKYQSLTQQRINKLKASEQQIESFLDFCAKEIRETQKLDELYSGKVAQTVNAPAPVKVKHPFKELIWGMLTMGTFSESIQQSVFHKLAGAGIHDAPIHSQDWRKSCKMYEKTGVSSGYRLFYYEIPHPLKTDFMMGVLNPKTGKVSYKNFSWFEDQKAWENYALESGWFARRAQEQKGITSIVYGEERDMAWSLWDDRMLARFVKYLKEKYSSIQELNKKWDCTYSDFNEIKLPLKQPESRQEHALWEDWTRYREIYHIQEEVMPIANIAKKYAPGLIHWFYGSYYMQGVHPANGINYYEVGKLFDPASMEGTFRIREEVLNADICGFQKKVIIPEWGTFYFPPAGARAQIDLLKAAAWNSVNWGMIGCHTFMGWRTNTDFVGSDGQMTYLGSQMKELNSDLKKLQHIYMDGNREEVAIRIVYSPTTRRHTSWPDIEEDKSLEAVCGYYEALRSLHCQARAIDEMAIMEGRLPKETKILIVPQVTYMNSELFKKLDEFVRNGGTLIATADAGRFDEYGLRQDYILSMSGVSYKKANSKKLEGVEFSTFAKDVFKLNAVMPENSKTVFYYEDGTEAAILSNVGKGKILILGVPFGREYNSRLKKVPGQALYLLGKILNAAGQRPDYVCADDHLVIRPWLYNGEKYLMLNYLQRDELTAQKLLKGFPLKKAPALMPFELSIRGSFDIEDYLLGKKLETTFDGTFTTLKGLIENPGGTAYRLIPASDKKLSADKIKDNQFSAPAEEANTDVQTVKSYPLPFEGRLFWDDGKVRLGDYTFSTDIVTECLWQGRTLVIVEHNGKILKKECSKGDKLEFRFNKKTLVIDCEDVVSVMPGNIKIRASEKVNQSESSGCRIREEKFHGQPSIVMENNYIFIRILPGLGGRIIEFKANADSPNNMFCDSKAVSGGLGNTTWVNYGGMEENAGVYPGPCWNIPFKYKIMENSKDKIVLNLERSNPIKWQISYGIKKQEGYNSFEKTFSIETGKAFLNVKVRQYNEMPGEDMLTLRTHPIFNIGGDISPEDTLFFPGSESNIVEVPYRTGTSTQFPNNGSWCAFIDKAKKTGIIQTFAINNVTNIYTWMGDDGYNLELVYDLFPTPPGKSVDFDYDIGIVNGLAGISGVSDAILIDIRPEGNGVYGTEKSIKFTAVVTALKETKAKIQSVIENKDNETVKTFNPRETVLKPEMPFSTSENWDSVNLPDGEYKITVRISAPGKKDFQFSRKIEIAEKSFEKSEKQIKHYRNILQEMKAQYKKQGDESLKVQITRASIILHELEEAVNSNDRAAINNSIVFLENILRLDKKKQM